MYTQSTTHSCVLELREIHVIAGGVIHSLGVVVHLKVKRIEKGEKMVFNDEN